MNRVCIIGGGLAGLSLGRILAGRGFPVTIREAGSYPRHKVCGEFLAGLDLQTIDTLDLREILSDALPLRRVGWFRCDKFVLDQVLPAPAMGLSRHTLDGRLADSFRALGGDLRERDRSGAPAEPGTVWAAGYATQTRSPWIGLKAHLREYAPHADLEVHLGRHAYAGISQVESGAFNLCGLFRQRPAARREGREALLRNTLRAAGLHRLAAAVEPGNLIPGSVCAIAGLSFGGAYAPSDVPILGDRRRMMPPFTGHGMTVALQSAALAIDPLSEWAEGRANWSDTVGRIQSACDQAFNRRQCLAGILHPFLWHPAGQQLLSLAVRLFPNLAQSLGRRLHNGPAACRT